MYIYKNPPPPGHFNRIFRKIYWCLRGPEKMPKHFGVRFILRLKMFYTVALKIKNNIIIRPLSCLYCSLTKEVFPISFPLNCKTKHRGAIKFHGMNRGKEFSRPSRWMQTPGLDRANIRASQGSISTTEWYPCRYHRQGYLSQKVFLLLGAANSPDTKC